MNAKTQNNKRHRSQRESGQAIVLIALIMVGLIAALGLAIDGGEWFFLNRDAQNAVDGAVLAAIAARCTDSNPQEVRDLAYLTANLNDFNDPNPDVLGDDPVEVIVLDGRDLTSIAGFDRPLFDSMLPAGVTITDDIGRYVAVNIKAEIPSYFIQLVYGGPLETDKVAIGYCSPAFDPDSIAALTALGNCFPSTLAIGGANQEIDGGLHGNGPVDIGGNASEPSLIDGPVTGTDGINPPDSDPKITYVEGTPNGSADPADPDIPWTASNFRPGGDAVDGIDPAFYFPIDAGGGNYTLSGTLEGVYYIYNVANVRITINGTGDRGATVAVDDVTDPTSLTPSGDGTISMNSTTGKFGPPFEGQNILMISDMDQSQDCETTNAISVNPNNIDLEGLIVAQYGSVQWGSANSRLLGAIVAETIKITGADNQIIYDPDTIIVAEPSVSIPS